MRRLFLIALVFSGCRFAGALPGYITFPSDIEWVTKSTAHFQVIYRRGNDGFADRAARAAERAYRILTPIFPEAPESTFLVLADFQDSPNGYALNFPYSHIVIFACPPESSGQLASFDEWLETIIFHEFVHIVHLYPAHGLWSPMRSIFGSWVVPNGLLPSHFHEGMATFFETEFNHGGRGRSSVFRMIQRMAVEKKVWGTTFVPIDLNEGSIPRWPQGASPYFFGYTLTQELWNRRGAKGIHDLTLSYSDNWPYFVNGPLEEVYGTTYPTLWEDIYEKTRRESEREIAEIKRTPLSSLTYLTSGGQQKWDVTASPDGRRVLFRRWNPHDGNAIDVIDSSNGRLRDTLDLHGGTPDGMCWGRDQGGEALAYLRSSSSDNYTLNTLWTYRFQNQESSQVNTNRPLNHLQRLSCTADLRRFLVYREADTQGELLELKWDAPDKRKAPPQIVREWKLREGDWITSLLVGQPSWILVRQGSSTGLYRWGTEAAPVKTASWPGHVFNLRAGGSPGELLAIASFDGRDEVWRLRTDGSNAQKVVGLLGGTNSFDSVGGTVLASSYEHGGYDIARASLLAPISRVIHPGSATRANAEATSVDISAARSYTPWGSLFPRAWVPSFLFVPNGFQVGAWIPGFDVAQKNLYDFYGGYDSRGLAFADLSYTYRFGRHYNLDASVYYLPSYIITTQSFLKYWGSSLGLGGYLGSFPAFIELSAIFKRLETSDLGGNVLPSNQSIGAQIYIDYKFGIKQRPLDISPITGTDLSLRFNQYLKAVGSTDNYFSGVAGWEQYLHMPWADGHVFYFNAKLGYTEGTAFYNSYFESGGDLLFYQVRGAFLNRGYLPGTFYARRIFNLNTEYRFPLFRVDRGPGLLPAFLRDVNAALVADATTLDAGVLGGLPDRLFRVFFTSVGAEIKSNWVFFFYLPTAIKLGGYHGFGAFGQQFYGTLGIEAAL